MEYGKGFLKEGREVAEMQVLITELVRWQSKMALAKLPTMQTFWAFEVPASESRQTYRDFLPF